MIESGIYQGGQEASEATLQEILSTIATDATLEDVGTLTAALTSNGTDTLRVREQGTVTISPADTLPVSHQGVIDVSSRESRNLGGVDLHETAAVSASTTSTGAANAADLELGRYRKTVDVHAEVSGAATLTVEVSTDGATWRRLDQQTLDSEAATINYTTGYPHVRAYVDNNVTVVEIAAKGA